MGGEKSGLTEMEKLLKKSLLLNWETRPRGLQRGLEVTRGRGGRGGGRGPCRHQLLPFCDTHLSVSCPAEIDLSMGDLGSMRFSGRICELHGRTEQVSTTSLEITTNGSSSPSVPPPESDGNVTAGNDVSPESTREKLPPPAQESLRGYFVFSISVAMLPPPFVSPSVSHLAGEAAAGASGLSLLLSSNTQPTAVHVRLLFLTTPLCSFPDSRLYRERELPYFSVAETPPCVR